MSKSDVLRFQNEPRANHDNEATTADFLKHLQESMNEASSDIAPEDRYSVFLTGGQLIWLDSIMNLCGPLEYVSALDAVFETAFMAPDISLTTSGKTDYMTVHKLARFFELLT